VTGVFEDHLAVDAVVAFVDGELGLTAYQRAAAHLSSCTACAEQVAEQEAVSRILRAASVPRMPGSLFASLASIPVAAPVTPPAPSVPGVLRMPGDRLGRTAEPARAAAGPLSTLGDQHPAPHRGRRLWFGAGALVAGVAMGAVMTASGGGAPTPVQSGATPVVPAPATAGTAEPRRR
jgi:anti-sigma factor RsiW